MDQSQPAADEVPFEQEYRVFQKSWGAEYTAAGEVRFRLWAPAVEMLSLRLGEEIVPMSPTGDGWFELLATNLAPGTPYAFVMPDGTEVPDPAGRALESNVHGPSILVDPTAYRWRYAAWSGRPWSEAVIYELHVGTFTEEGTFAAAAKKLPGLADLGITMIELMPVAAFGGARGWGYDGVLLYTPHPAYGSPDDMKAFVDTAHGLGLMVVLDVAVLSDICCSLKTGGSRSTGSWEKAAGNCAAISARPVPPCRPYTARRYTFMRMIPKRIFATCLNSERVR